MSQAIELEAFVVIHSRNRTQAMKREKDMSGADGIKQNGKKLT